MRTSEQAFHGAYEEHGGGRVRVCKALGISRATFYNLKNRYIDGEKAPIVIPIAVDPDGGGAADAEALAALLQRLAGSGVDHDQVRGMVEAHVTAELSAQREALEALVVEAKEAAKSYRGIEVKVAGKDPVKVEGIVPDWFDRVLVKVTAGIHVLLVGPSGCGKTHVTAMVAEALGMRFGFLSLSGGVSESKLMGRRVPSKDGGMCFEPAPFVDFYEHGGLFVLDEVDAADPNVLVAINAAIANGHMALPDRLEEPLAKRHEGFRLIAIGNTYGHGATVEFQGRMAQDGAFLDRFRAGVVECDYSPKVEGAIVDNEVLAWGMDLRAKIRAAGIRRNVTTRNLVDFTKLKGAGETREDWERSFFAGWAEGEVSKVKG